MRIRKDVRKATSLELAWDNNKGAQWSEVDLTPPGGGVPQKRSPAVNSTTLVGLNSDTPYTYTIKDDNTKAGPPLTGTDLRVLISIQENTSDLPKKGTPDLLRGTIYTQKKSAQAYSILRQLPQVSDSTESQQEGLSGESQKRPPTVFNILLPNNTSLLHYTWPSRALSTIPLQLQDQLTIPDGAIVQDTAISLIQSWQFPKDLEAIAHITTKQGDDILIVFQFTPGINQPTSFLLESDGVIDRVTGAPALIQDDQDLFNLLVPRADGLFHYTHTNKTLDGPWELKRQLTIPQRLNVVSLGFAQTDGVGGMVAVARVQEVANAPEAVNIRESSKTNLRGFSNINFLVSYTYIADKGWQTPITVSIDNAPVMEVIGTPALIASNTSEGQERLELLVPTTEGLQHLINTPDAPANQWQLVAVLEPLNDGRTITPVLASLVQTEPGKLQAFVRAETSDGLFLLITYSYDRATNSWSGPAKLQVPDASDGGGKGNGDDHGGGHGGDHDGDHGGDH